MNSIESGSREFDTKASRFLLSKVETIADILFRFVDAFSGKINWKSRFVFKSKNIIIEINIDLKLKFFIKKTKVKINIRTIKTIACGNIAKLNQVNKLDKYKSLFLDSSK